MVGPLRVVLRLRDGQVLSGYTPAFAPEDGSVWVSPAPSSPAGTMIKLEKVEVLLIESKDGRPATLPASAVLADDSGVVQVAFDGSEPVYGRIKAKAPGIGLWLQPVGRAFARAFVPSSATSSVFPGDPSDDDAGWAFVVSASELGLELEVGTFDGTPTDGVTLPGSVEIDRAKSTATAAITAPPVRLSAPPAPASTPVRIAMKSSSSSATDILAVVETAKTQPDMKIPNFEET